MIFNVNWFQTDDNGRIIWPGFRDNLRVIKWIIERCENKVDAEKTPIGYLPKAEDLSIEGLEKDGFGAKELQKLLTLDIGAWEKEINEQTEFLKKFENLPEEIKHWNKKIAENIGRKSE